MEQSTASNQDHQIYPIDQFDKVLQHHEASLKRLINENSQLIQKVANLELIIENSQKNRQNRTLRTSEKSERFMTKVKRSFIRAIESTSCHGLPKIMTSNHIAFKVLWTIFFILSMAGFSYFIEMSIYDYFGYQVITNINIKMDKNIRFPSVTICKDTPGKFDIEKMLYICRFNNRDCMASDFERVELFDDFNLGIKECVIFNHDANKRLEKKGFSHGLLMNLLLLEKQYFKIILDEFLAKPMLEKNAEIVTSGDHLNMKLNKLIEKKLGYPYNNCKVQLSSSDDYNSEFYRTIINSGYKYTQEYCYHLCHFDYIFKQCNCYLPGLNEVENYKYCTKNDKFFLQHCFSDIYNRKNEFDFDLLCSQQCPLECVTTDYKIQTQYFNFKLDYRNFAETDKALKKQVVNRLGIQNLSMSLLKKKSLSISIFYEDFRHTEIKQIPKMTIPDLVSNFGGTLGLFLGLSLLSCVEIAEFITEVLLIMCEHMKLPRKE